MKSFLCYIGFVFFQLAVVAQTGGYLGKQNYIELKAVAVPSSKHLNVIKDDESIKRLKYLNTSYKLTLNRVLTKNFELSLGYEFAKMNCISDGSYFLDDDTTEDMNVYTYTKNILDDPQMTYHGFQFAFNFYRLGSLAPIGKYIGLSVSYGIATLAEDEPVIVGQRDFLTKDSFFKKAGPIADQEIFNIQTEKNIKSFHLRARIGRSYPISDYMMISVGMTFPVISKYTSGTISQFGFQLDGGYDESETSPWTRYAMSTVKYYNRIIFETGIRFHF